MLPLESGEIGVRMALGARPAVIQKMVIVEGLIVAAWGIGLGVAAAIASTRVLQSLLFDVRPTDPWIYAGISATIVAVACCASWLPARRAARIDPLAALRMP